MDPMASGAETGATTASSGTGSWPAAFSITVAAAWRHRDTQSGRGVECDSTNLAVASGRAGGAIGLMSRAFVFTCSGSRWI
jgi:hypothetical protein